MLSKEEILAKRVIKFPSDEIMVEEAIRKNVLAAMDEYAKQESESWKQKAAAAIHEKDMLLLDKEGLVKALEEIVLYYVNEPASTATATIMSNMADKSLEQFKQTTMTPIQKAKEMFEAFFKYHIKSNNLSLYTDLEDWLDTPEAAALLSGEDWKGLVYTPIEPLDPTLPQATSKRVDDGQEGKVLKFIEWEYKVRPSLVDWDLTDMGKQGWQLCAVNDKYYYFKRPLPEPPKP